MIEFLVANMAEIILTVLAGAVGTLITVLKRGFGDLKKDVAERKVLWDEEMIKINHKFDELLADHADIKRDLSTIKKELTEKVEKIMVDHASHERDQAVQLEILRDLKEIARDKK